jgi:hypothetical protein
LARSQEQLRKHGLGAPPRGGQKAPKSTRPLEPNRDCGALVFRHLEEHPLVEAFEGGAVLLMRAHQVGSLEIESTVTSREERSGPQKGIALIPMLDNLPRRGNSGLAG